MPERFENLRSRYGSFVEDRDWEQYHTPQNLSMAISVEANELLECFLWQDNVSPEQVRNNDELMRQVEEELADVVIYCLGLANRLDIDVLDAVESKLDANEERFDDERVAEINEKLDHWQRD